MMIDYVWPVWGLLLVIGVVDPIFVIASGGKDARHTNNGGDNGNDKEKIHVFGFSFSRDFIAIGPLYVCQGAM